MALPSSGWVSGNEQGVVTRFPLPQPVKITYSDKGFNGSPSAYIAHIAGGPTVAKSFGSRYLSIEIAINTVFDVVLIDRIE